jgi:hypothetical protein
MNESTLNDLNYENGVDHHDRMKVAKEMVAKLGNNYKYVLFIWINYSFKNYTCKDEHIYDNYKYFDNYVYLNAWF